MSRPSPALPAGLAAAIARQLERRPRKALQESAQRLSENYRARKPTDAAIRDETDALAYALPGRWSSSSPARRATMRG